MKKKYEIPWWNEWYEALDKREKVASLPALKLILDKFPRKCEKHVVASIINFLFEDLRDFMFTKVKEEEKDNHKQKGNK